MCVGLRRLAEARSRSEPTKLTNALDKARGRFVATRARDRNATRGA